MEALWLALQAAGVLTSTTPRSTPNSQLWRQAPHYDEASSLPKWPMRVARYLGT